VQQRRIDLKTPATYNFYYPGGLPEDYGIYQNASSLSARASHGESISDLGDAEVRGAWLGLTADALSIAALGSAVKLGKGGLGLLQSADEMGSAGRMLNGASTVADGAAITDSTVTLAQNWDKLSPEQRLMTIGQLGFWGTMGGLGAMRSGGHQNLYGGKDLKNFFGDVKGQKPSQRKGDRTPEVANNEAESPRPLEARVSESNGEYRSTPEIRREFREFFGKERYAEYAEKIEQLKLTYPELRNIPTEDLVAVRGYTSDDYRMLNKALRSGDPEELARLNAYIKAAESGLSQLPSYNGNVFRGTNLSPELAAKYKPGEIVTEEAFFSTSAEMGKEFPGNTKFFIKSLEAYIPQVMKSDNSGKLEAPIIG
jgi:hypothetical protein